MIWIYILLFVIIALIVYLIYLVRFWVGKQRKRVTTVRKLRTREIAVGPLRNSDVATQVRQPDRNGRGLRVTECQYRRRN